MGKTRRYRNPSPRVKEVVRYLKKEFGKPEAYYTEQKLFNPIFESANPSWRHFTAKKIDIVAVYPEYVILGETDPINYMSSPMQLLVYRHWFWNPKSNLDLDRYGKRRDLKILLFVREVDYMINEVSKPLGVEMITLKTPKMIQYEYNRMLQKQMKASMYDKTRGK